MFTSVSFLGRWLSWWKCYLRRHCRRRLSRTCSSSRSRASNRRDWNPASRCLSDTWKVKNIDVNKKRKIAWQVQKHCVTQWHTRCSYTKVLLVKLTQSFLLLSVPDVDETVRTTRRERVVLIVKCYGVYLCTHTHTQSNKQWVKIHRFINFYQQAVNYSGRLIEPDRFFRRRFLSLGGIWMRTSSFVPRDLGLNTRPPLDLEKKARRVSRRHHRQKEARKFLFLSKISLKKTFNRTEHVSKFVGETSNAARLIFEARFTPLLNVTHVSQIPDEHFAIGRAHNKTLSTQRHRVNLTQKEADYLYAVAHF